MAPEKAPQSRLNDALKTALKVVFSAGLIWWLVRKGVLDFESLKAVATPGLIAFFLACVFIQIFINNLRWLTLMKAQGLDTTVRETMPLTLIGMFFNFAMPGGVGGDVIKGYYVVQDHPQAKVAAAVSIFMDRLIGFFVMIATAFVALFLNWQEVSESPQLRSLALGVALLFFAFLVFFAISFSKLKLPFEKIPGGVKIRRVYEALHSYRRTPGALFKAVSLSFLSQLFIVGFVVVVGNALGLQNEISLPIYFFLVPLGTVAQAIPVSPAGIGVGQAAFFFLFKLHLHHDSPVGPVAVTATQACSFAWGLIGAYYYLRRSHRNSRRRAS